MTLWYIATTYSKHPAGLQKAWEDATIAASVLLKRGEHIYSPIVHTHPIAQAGALDLTDHEFWMAFDDAMIRACDGLTVVMMPGWDTSRGIAHEIEAFGAQKKPIRWLSWPDLEEGANARRAGGA